MVTVVDRAQAPLQSEPALSGAGLRKVYAGWLLIALVLTLFRVVPALNQEFDYPQAWVAADFATMARTFETSGVIALRGVPVNNNAPLGVVPPAYTHWPPLFPLLLGGWFHVFGTTERSAHLLMLVLLVATSTTLFALARACFSPMGALMTLTAWLAMPAIVRYARAPIHLHLCVLLMLLAILCFLHARQPGSPKYWQVLGMAALIFSILTSWEGVLLPLGWLGHAILTRNGRQRRIAIWNLVAGITCAAVVVAWYLAVYPQQFSDLKGVLLMRLRFVSSYAVDPLNDSGSQSPLNLWGVILFQALRTWDMLGSVSLFALGILFVEAFKSRGRFASDAFAASVSSLGGIWLVWYSALSHHAAMHDYEALIVAPLAAFSIARLIERGLKMPGRGGPGEKIVAWAIVLPAVVVYPLAAAVFFPIKPAPADVAMVSFGRDLGRLTSPGSVILTPECNMVPVYYSRRRVIRCVETVARMEAVTAALPAAFPAKTAVFFAVPHDSIEKNRDLLKTIGAAPEGSSLVLVPLGRAGELAVRHFVP